MTRFGLFFLCFKLLRVAWNLIRWSLLFAFKLFPGVCLRLNDFNSLSVVRKIVQSCFCWW